MLTDRYQRRTGYLRLSLTKACAMRCTYCRPDRLGQPCGEPVLTPDEVESLVRHLAAEHGLRKVRLTGGDPTSRRELLEIIERIAAVPGIVDLAMTTNGLTLARHASTYANAGVQRLNVSIDSLDPERFADMTGVNGLDRVLRGLDAADDAGLAPIKINTVVLRDQNEVDMPGLLRFAAERGYELRFIELMPMGPLAGQWSERYVPEPRMRRNLEPLVRSWRPLEQGAESARRYEVELKSGGSAVVGFITPMSCNFCSACNRIRIAADGSFYPCLMDEPRGSLLPAMRPRFDGRHIDRILAAGLSEKQAEHPHDGFVVMTHIGG